MKLRQWQKACVNKAIRKFRQGQQHFLCLATPGAGKTIMASILSKRLLDDDLIDLVVCFSPSQIVSLDFGAEVERQAGIRMNGKLGSHGRSLTYQAMLNLDDEFWGLFNQYRVFVIFDEIHHCSGSDVFNANAWGQILISKIQDNATYSLALTGTPWRSDSIPIALSKYQDDTKLIHCDYQYGLAKAIGDAVCRTPRLTLIDNDNIQLKSNEKIEIYRSFSNLLDRTDCSYQQLIENSSLISYTLKKANRKLNSLRRKTPDAGGLIVAASVSHAKTIREILRSELGENAAIATYLETDALSIINTFKSNKSKWIISVGMISEGTNIPRLRVCCHLSRVKTELYFRQILGRILRAQGTGEEGFFYMPAEPSLITYAHQLAEDIPVSNIVKTDLMKNQNKNSDGRRTSSYESQCHDIILSTGNHMHGVENYAPSNPDKSSLADTYERTIGIFGRFKVNTVDLNLQTSG